MKKIAIAVIAIAGISSAALAGSNRNSELRDSPTYYGKYSESGKSASGASGAFGYSGDYSAKPLAVPSDGSGGITNFDRMNQRAWERDHGDR